MAENELSYPRLCTAHKDEHLSINRFANPRKHSDIKNGSQLADFHARAMSAKEVSVKSKGQ